MVKTCVVFGCKARDDKLSNRSFHAFPRARPDICQQWLKNVNRKDEKSGKLWQPTKYSRICSDHFLPGDFEIDTLIKKLKESAIPTVFATHPQNLQPKNERKRSQPKERSSSNTKHMRLDSSTTTRSPSFQTEMEHSYCVPSIEEQLEQTKKNLAEKEALLTEKNKEIRLLNQKLKRRDDKIAKLLVIMEENKILSAKQHDLLKSNFNEDTYTLIENELKAHNMNPHGMRYSDELKKFAVTLHFYSSKAYDYVRKFLSLPHPSSIQKWAKSRDCNPGFMAEVLQTLDKTHTPDTSDVALMFDCMHLKKGWWYDNGKKCYIGSVDLGEMTVDDNDSPALQVLVVMVVGLKKHFKQPIGYFFINTVSAETQAQIIKDALILLSEIRYTVHAVICDGCYTNQATAAALGCEITPKSLNHTFSHPVTDKQVFFVYDACHLIKNIRNCLGDLKVLYYQGQKINWEYIVQLDIIQREDNLVLANKLRGKHVNYGKNKMNVKFAVQTISSSVATAIDFLREDMSLPQFHGSEATTTFLKVFDRLFDLCNSSSPFGKAFKSPMRISNLEFRSKQTTKDVKYILELTDSSGKPLVTGKRKTGFLGFICTLYSTIGLSKRLLCDMGYDYFMTYRLSQDHLETFFSRIRRKNGWNNNPTPAQFKWALRALLLKNGVVASQKANCVTIEEPSNKVIASSRTTSCKELQHLLRVLENPSIYHDHSLYYISGFIARKIADRAECSKCAQSLMVKNNSNGFSSFTQRASNGGLIQNNDMFKIIKSADKHFREILTTKGIIRGVDKRLIPTVTNNVLSAVSTTVFPDIWSHSLERSNLETEDNHVCQVIKEACKLFCNTMIRHHERLIQDRYLFKDSGTQRHRLTKTVLFLNQ